jgi:hypothetical protein
VPSKQQAGAACPLQGSRAGFCLQPANIQNRSDSFLTLQEFTGTKALEQQEGLPHEYP